MANLSQQKRQRMLDFLETIKKNNPNEDTRIAINEIENELTEKKYGLVWEKHEENVDIQMKTNVPVFTEIKDKEIVGVSDSNDFNFLLEGDNLHSLKLLEKTHKGKVDVIYIDPPYNTGNAFTYADETVDLNDNFRHSKWLSFMQERLVIAKKLLSESGIIFISIDDNEQATLKLICDEIFGEMNFFTQIIVQSNKRGQTYKQVAKTHEYILVYTKSPDAEFNEIEKDDDTDDLNMSDNISNFNVREIRNRNPKFGRFNRPNLFFAFYVNPNIVDKDGFNPVSLEQSDDYTIEVFPYNSKGEESCWRWSEKLAKGNINPNTLDSNVVAKVKRDGGYNIYEKYRKTTYKAKSIWDDTNMITEHGTVQLGELGLANLFDFPKPVELISKCLQIGSKKDSVVLDFFAGSGTTGQAVLELNKRDKGNRKFILCTNNENNICENVTYERVKKVILGYDFTGKREDILFEKKVSLKGLSSIEKDLKKIETIIADSEPKYAKVSSAFKDGVLSVIGTQDTSNGVDGIPANLKYYKTDFIPKTSDDEFYSVGENLMEHIKEMVQLEHGISLDNDEYLLLLSDEDADELEKNEEKLSNCKGIYISSSVFLTSKQKQLFNGVSITSIPDYYFEKELREVGEL